MVRSIGIIGLSEGNGHPFSYGSIINGYSPEGLAASGWPGINDYVTRRHASEFGLDGWTITHAWTQDPESTERLCAACRILHGVDDYRELLGAVDAVIIARDDYETHSQMALPFLEAGLPVFIDKPLSLEVSELQVFKPFLETVLAVTPAHPVSVRMMAAEHASAIVRLDDGVILQIDALGDSARTFHLEIFGTKRNGAFDITDNFSMFRRMLWEFAESIRTGQPAIPPERTLEIMRVLIAGRMARNESREVFLHELPL
jgi:predicted dehydrogenase